MSDNGETVADVQQDWELSKENYQPLKAGRKPGGLRDPSATEKKLSIDEQREKFNKSIEDYTGDDPLELWLSYIKWTQDNFKAGGHKADLLPLLERCTRKLQGMDRYKDDVRYLRVWVQYADCLPDPTDVFKFLKENEIGQSHALFYIAYATFLELRGNYAAADNVYQQGVNRLAAPQDRLRSKFNEFQHRMARRIQRKAQEQSSGAEDPELPERQSLAVLGGRRSVRPSGLASQKRKAVATPGKKNAPAESGLEIFVDEEFGGPAASAPPALAIGGSSSAAAGPTSTAWASLPSFEQTRKENTQKAASWAGQRVKQTQAYAPPPMPALAIPQDPEFATAEAAQARREAAAEANQLSVRQRLDRGGLDEQLTHDPLRLHRDPPPVVAPAEVPKPTVPRPKAPKEEALACKQEALQGEDGDEQSFEEVRAAIWLQKHHISSYDDANEDVEMEIEEPAPPSPIAAAAVEVKSTPFDQPAQETTAVHPTRVLAENAMHEAGTSGDVTLATRGAFDAINAAFGGMFGGDAPMLAEDAAGMEPTMTISTKEAFASINNMFSNKNSSFSSTAASQDVTLTTKAAFEALNAAFGGTLGVRRTDAAVAQGQPTAHRSGMFVRQDSSLRSDAGVSEPHPALAAPSGGFDIREDTVFVTTGDPTDGGLSIREDTVFIGAGASHPAPADQGGFAIREDTIFINPRAAPPHGAPQQEGFAIREDTVFIDRRDTQAVNAGHGAFDIREDTLFINAGASSERASEGGLAIREDTVFFNQNHEDELDGNDTTEIIGGEKTMPLGAVPSAHSAHPTPAFSTGLSVGMHDLQLAVGQHTEEVSSPGDENSMPGNTAATRVRAPRDVRNPAVAPLALRPLSADAMAKLGGTVEENLEADAALSHSPEKQIPLQDEVDVYADENSEAQVIDPFNDKFQSTMLSMLSPSVEQWPGVDSVAEDTENAALSSFKRVLRSGAPPVQISLGGRSYQVHCSIGAGAYATVYKAVDCATGIDTALKVESPACPWEWYVCKVVAGRVPAAQRGAFLDPSYLALGPGASFVEMPRGRHGSLHDLLNAYLKKGERLEEVVVAHLAVALLRMLGDLHAAHVLHNDIKPDNLLVTYDSSGSDVTNVGLQLIDFGRSVDLELLPPGSVMSGDCGTEAFRCVEMREGQPWLWQGDAYGAAGVLHCLLFGEYMEVERVMNAEGATFLRIKSVFRRYWQRDMWDSVFSQLLNWTTLDAATPPPWGQLAEMVEIFLATNKDAQRTQQGELNKLLALL